MWVRIPRPKICKLACKAKGVGIFAKGEIPVRHRILFLVTLQCEHNQSATHFDVGSHTPPGGSYPHPILAVYALKGEVITRR